MDPFEVRFSDQALDDFNGVLAYILRVHKNRAAAESLRQAQAAGRLRLERFADGCPASAEADLVDFDCRDGLFGTRTGRKYRMVFALEGNLVRVLRIRSQDQRLLTRRELMREYLQSSDGPASAAATTD